MSDIHDKNYNLLGRGITSLFDMSETKEAVFSLVSTYKKNRFLYFVSKKNLEKFSLNYDGQFLSTNSRSDKIGNSTSQKIDSENFCRIYEEIMSSLYEEMCPIEKKYYTYVLSNDRSEQSVADVCGLSKEGLKVFKNSCILKIGLAFNIAVPNSKTKKL